MPIIASALMLALRQLADPRIMRLLGKTLAITLALFAMLGWVGWQALDWAFAAIGLEDQLFTGAGGLRGVAAFVVTLLGGWLLWRIIAMAVMEFYADEVVLAVEAAHYPEAARQARELTVPQQAAAAMSATGRAVLANLIALPFALLLLITGIGTALLFWLVNALLIGGELDQMVWQRHRPAPNAPSPVTRGERFVLGAAIAGLMLVPFINLLAPILGAAGATHLNHRKRAAEHA